MSYKYNIYGSYFKLDNIDIPINEIVKWGRSIQNNFDFDTFYYNTYDYYSYVNKDDSNAMFFDEKYISDKYRYLINVDKCRLCTNKGLFNFMKKYNMDCREYGVYYYIIHGITCMEKVMGNFNFSIQELSDALDRIKVYEIEHSGYRSDICHKIEQIKQKIIKENK